VPLYNAGNAYLQVIPSFKGIEALMKKELAKLGAQVDGALQKGVADGFAKGAKAGGEAAADQLDAQADKAAGAYAAKFQRRISEALKSLGGEVEIDANTSDFDRKYQSIIADLKELNEKEISPSFNAKQAAMELDDLGQRMRDLENDAPDLNKKFNLRQARAEAESFLQDLRNNGATTGAELGRRLSGALNEELRKGTKGALDSLPEFRIDANTTPAQQKVMDLRALLSRLQADIEVGLNDSVAETRLRVIIAELEYLDRFEADPSVSVNSGVALAKLASVKKLMDSMDGDTVDVDVDVDGDGGAATGLRNIAEEAGVSMSRLGYLVSIGGAVGTAIVPAAAAAAVAVAGLGFAALGAAAGIGTLFLAFNGIGDAVKALHTYNQDADKSAKSLASSTNAIANATDAVKGAQDGLARARENAAERQREAANRIKEANEAIRDAEQNVADAVRDVARARRDGMRAVRDAIEEVKDADRDYTEALDSQREAREALNRAYKQAVRDLAELNSQVKHNALDQRQAALDEIEAREELDKFLLNPRATEAEREQARITYEERLLQIQDLKRKGEELAEAQADANEKGIEGSEAVTRAQKQLKDANDAVEKATRGQRDAQERLTRTQEDAAERIADAQRNVAKSQDRLADAQTNLIEEQREAANSQRDSQRQIAAAQRSLAAANRQLAQSYTSAATAGGDALDTLNDKMADLSPAGRAFVLFLDRVMRPALDRLQEAAQEGLFPGLTAGLTELVSGGRLDAFADFVYDVADAMGDSFEYAVKQLQDPIWKEFFGYIGQTAGPVIRGATVVALNFAKGIAGIMNALTGFNGGMGDGLIRLSEGFARWAESLSTNKGFQAFIEYVRTEGPHVVGLLKQFAIFFGRIVIAAAPIGAIVVRVFEAFFAILNKIPLRDLALLLGVLAALSIALLVLAVGTALVTASFGTLIALGVAALAAGLAILYNRFEGFRNVVDTTFRVVGAVIMWLWKNVWIPFYTALWKGLVWLYKNVIIPVVAGMVNRFRLLGEYIGKIYEWAKPGLDALGAGIMWLWENAIKPALGFIGAIFQWLWQKAIKPVLDLWSADTEKLKQQQAPVLNFLAGLFRMLGAVALWLWNNALKPAFQSIGAIALWLWQNVLVPAFQGIALTIGIAWTIMKAIFGAIVAAAQFMGSVFSWLWKNIIEPAWTGIRITVSIAWAILKVIFGLIQIALKALGLAFRALYMIFVKPWLDAVASLAKWLWEKALRPAFKWIKEGFSEVGAAFGVAYKTVIKPLWDSLAAMVSKIWTDKIKPVFTVMGKIWTDHIVPAWKKGIEAAGKLWDGLKNAAKLPVKFIVNTVMNDGLLRGYNWLAEKFNVTPKNVKITLPDGFAVGGQIDGPGTSTSDSVLIRASRGEHMWTAREVNALGGHGAVYALRRAVTSGWKPPGFAKGGAIGDDGFTGWLKKQAKGLGKKAAAIFEGTAEFLANPSASLKTIAENLLAKMPLAGTDIGKQLAGVPKAVLGGLVNKVKDLFFGGGSDGGPVGAGPGFSPWPSSPSAQRGDSGVWRSLLNLVRQANIPYSFGNSYRPGDPKWHGSGRAIDFMGYNLDRLAQFFMNMKPRVLELIHRTNTRDYGISRGRNAQMPTQWPLHRNHLHVAMDEGGWLQPGYTSIYNGTGSPEPVLTSKQWQIMAANTRGGDTAGSSYNFEFRDTTLDAGKLRALQDREAFMARQGRAR
jgi:hypothetical protein